MHNVYTYMTHASHNGDSAKCQVHTQSLYFRTITITHATNDLLPWLPVNATGLRLGQGQVGCMNEPPCLQLLHAPKAAIAATRIKVNVYKRTPALHPSHPPSMAIITRLNTESVLWLYMHAL